MTIDGDSDGSRYDALPERAQGQELFHVAVTSNDEKNHAYVRHALTDLQRMNVDMAIDGGWYRYSPGHGGEFGSRTPVRQTACSG